MRRIESSAVVLGARVFGESDLLVDLLVRDAGRITGVAKSAKKSKKRSPKSLTGAFSSVTGSTRNGKIYFGC